MTYSHEDSTQEKTENCKSHTYCMGNRGKDRTTYGGNKWKDPRLGKTNNENIVKGHETILDNDTKGYRDQTRHSRLYQPRHYSKYKKQIAYEVHAYCMNYSSENRNIENHRENTQTVAD
eukprot:5730765-Heterocapsa_arctica.AAC.1